jgi:hypothetical protein
MSNGRSSRLVPRTAAVPPDQPRQRREVEWALAGRRPRTRAAGGDDSAAAATTAESAATVARIAGTAASVRHGSDNQIHETYVW